MSPEVRKEQNVQRFNNAIPAKVQKICACGRTFGRDGDQCSYCYYSSKGEGNRVRAHRTYQKRKAAGEYSSHNWRSVGVLNRDGTKLTAKDVDRENEKQGGICAICGDPPNGKRLAVDHDHTTGIIRGLLCSRCNMGLGYFRDNPEFLRIGADYLAA